MTRPTRSVRSVVVADITPSSGCRPPKGRQFTSPEVPDHGVCTADVPLVELDLTLGAKIAYVFDFGPRLASLLSALHRFEPERIVDRRAQPDPRQLRQCRPARRGRPRRDCATRDLA